MLPNTQERLTDALVDMEEFLEAHGENETLQDDENL